MGSAERGQHSPSYLTGGDQAPVPAESRTNGGFLPQNSFSFPKETFNMEGAKLQSEFMKIKPHRLLQ